ncbi:unnamed protein product, partial [Closterium sp. NIES-54]
CSSMIRFTSGLSLRLRRCIDRRWRRVRRRWRRRGRRRRAAQRWRATRRPREHCCESSRSWMALRTARCVAWPG